LASLAVLACLAGPARAAIRTSTSSFLAGGKPVRVDHFAPDRAGKHPAALLLHGSTGLADQDAQAYRSVAGLLANNGYVALLVHYFESTETERIDPQHIDERLFRTWMGVVHGAVEHAAALPGVGGERIGLVGFSLGACLTPAAGEEGGSRVAAVVDLFGCLPDEVAANAARLPPTLVLHGDADTVVWVEKARALEGLLKKYRRTFDIKVYEKQGHLFQGAGPFDRAVLDAQARTLDFLARHLRRPDGA
jgi:carboxymethylenebutenolidase